ncbi:MAG: STAS domain-containing protein [Victivallaceae bacterium]|nr:STAS domain-containing protein [Victivallaceae bacterium]
MNASDLLISNRDGVCSVRVTGRANFEYAVPLRDLARKIDAVSTLEIDLGGCTAMDSTFMGVLTMLAVALHRSRRPLTLCNASETLKALLRGLGILKLFVFTERAENAPETPELPAGQNAAAALQVAETVVEAHRTLAQADAENEKRFAAVIRFAEADAEKLREAEKK